MSPLALRQQIGQLLVAGFDGPEIPVELKALAREFSIGGVILFKRNVEDPDQVKDVARQIEALGTELPPWVAVDQEGGRVARLKRPFTEWPPMIALGRSGSTDLARRFARALAEELAAVGVTLDYAPVLDVLTSTKNPAIGDRALADTVDVVSELGRVIIAELQNPASPRAGNTFPVMGTRRSIHITNCPSSSTRRIGSARSSSGRSKPRLPPGLHPSSRRTSSCRPSTRNGRQRSRA